MVPTAALACGRAATSVADERPGGRPSGTEQDAERERRFVLRRGVLDNNFLHTLIADQRAGLCLGCAWRAGRVRRTHPWEGGYARVRLLQRLLGCGDALAEVGVRAPHMRISAVVLDYRVVCIIILCTYLSRAYACLKCSKKGLFEARGLGLTRGVRFAVWSA